jgi:ribonuclease HI
MSSKYHQQLQIFLYKNKLNELSIMDLLTKFSTTTIKHIIQDLGIIEPPKESNELYIFSDGNCKNNGKSYAKAGYSVFFTDGKINSLEESPYYKFNKTRLIVSEPTNNKSELSGIKYIFKTIHENEALFNNKKNIICTDSMYSINCIDKWSKAWQKNGWKNSKGQEVKNKDLIQEILQLRDQINKDIKICFKHVMGHTTEPYDKNSMEWLLWYGNNKVDSNINELFTKNETI